MRSSAFGFLHKGKTKGESKIDYLDYHGRPSDTRGDDRDNRDNRERKATVCCSDDQSLRLAHPLVIYMSRWQLIRSSLPLQPCATSLTFR